MLITNIIDVLLCLLENFRPFLQLVLELLLAFIHEPFEVPLNLPLELDVKFSNYMDIVNAFDDLLLLCRQESRFRLYLLR